MMHEPKLAEEVLAEISRLYQSPETLKIVEIARNDKAPVQSFADAMVADALFAERLLGLANFTRAGSQRFTTVSAVVSVFGLDNLKSLALGLSVFALPRRSASRDNNGADYGSTELRNLWEHCLGTGVFAAQLASRLGTVSPVQAFTAGFIHDVGKTVLYRHAPARFMAATALAIEKHIPSTQAEILSFGVDHVKAGEEWSLKLELPPPLRAVLRFHHERVAGLPDSVVDEVRHLIAIVQIADALCEAHAIGKGGDGVDWPRELRMILRLREEDWPDQPQAVKRNVEAARESFGFARHDIKKLPAEPRGPEKSSGRMLPLRRKTAARAETRQVVPFPTRQEAAPNPEAKPASRKLAVLVVEDHSSLCDLLSLYLMRHGYHVRTAANGEGAIEILAKEEIHLVLLDLMLPRVDGFEVLRQVHKTQRDKTPYIIVLSAGASERDREKVLELGADEYMPKPFHLLRLLERIQVVEKYLL